MCVCRSLLDYVNDMMRAHEQVREYTFSACAAPIPSCNHRWLRRPRRRVFNMLRSSTWQAGDTGNTLGRLRQQLVADGVRLRPKFTPGNPRKRLRNQSRCKIDAFKTVQLKQLKRFRRQAESQQWGSIHHAHFDWYMFPIEDGSQRRYNVFAEDVAELKGDSEWLSRYRESVQLVSYAWGWDVEKAAPVQLPGAKWTNWDVRLAKIIRSLWIFEQDDFLESMQKFALKIAPRGGLSYGYIRLDEVFLMRPATRPSSDAADTDLSEFKEISITSKEASGDEVARADALPARIPRSQSQTEYVVASEDRTRLPGHARDETIRGAATIARNNGCSTNNTAAAAAVAAATDVTPESKG